jgi:hypothetical protein|nr:hypothetical protein [uncultured Acetatifactor sp.]
MKQPKRQITAHDIYNLPSFLRVELIDGVIYTDDWTSLEIDEKVFEFPASENRHIKYKLSIVEIEEKEIPKP